MKKQTLVILAIIAVITTLLTVSALSNEEGYKLSPCDAIDISLENATVTDFLNATNMTTVQVYNFKGYKGENTWMVQWSSSNRLLDVYVNVATGYIEGIEKITVPEALKAWVVANYGDGTRVTSDSADKLIDAMMMGTLAPLPAGYTSADITQDVWKWALNNVGWKPSTTTPPVTPMGPPDAIKAWIVANYGDGTRVTSDSADKLSLALLTSSLAPLPTGYTSADITQDVYRWTRDNVGWTSTVTPPVTPPVSPPVSPPTEPPEAIKAWIVANYGDGTRVTSDGWRRLSDAEMANTLAPLPAGYTKADITDEVMVWAIENPNWEIQTICGWINSIGVTNLTEDHGLYVYDLAVGWTTVADSIYDTLSPKPSRLPAALATEDNGRGVYGYAIGWNTLANEITGCNFWTTPTSTKRVIDTVEIGVEIVGPTPTPSVTPTPTPDPKPCWHTVNTFQGRYDKRTPSFTIKGDTWRMNWETVGREDTSSIAVTVYKVLMYNEWADYFSQDTFPSGADTYCVYTGAGTYYLGISANDLEYWSIEIEDFY